MRILLDTCAFLWIANQSPNLTHAAAELFSSPHNEVFLSAASAWEIGIKHSAGKLRLPESPERFVPAARMLYSLQALPVTEDAVIRASQLPQIHRDPFDRLLVAQANLGGMVILTPDDQIRAYGVRTEW